MDKVLWKILRFVTSNLGSILIGLGITMVLFSLISQDAMDNIPLLDESAKISANRFVEDNYDVLHSDIQLLIEEKYNVDLESEIDNIDIESMRKLCSADQSVLDITQDIPDGLCDEIENLSEDEIKDMLLNEKIDEGIETIINQTTNISSSIEQGLRNEMNTTLEEISDKYVGPMKWIGMLMICLGATLIFVSRKFAVYPSLYSIGVNLTLNVGLFSIMFWFIRNLTSEKSVEILKGFMTNEEMLELPNSLIQLVLTIVSDWLMQVLGPLMKLSVIAVIILLITTIALYLLMKKDEKRAKRYEALENKLRVIKSETDMPTLGGQNAVDQ